MTNEPAGMVLVYVEKPAVGIAVTRTVIIQVPGVVELPAGMVPPVRVTVRGKVVVTVPPQVVVAEPSTTLREEPDRVSEILTPVT